VSTEQINALLTATGNTEVEPFYPIIFANYLSSPEKIAQIIAVPSAGGGGGDAAVVAAPAEVEKEEEVEADMGGAMFGGGDKGGGDY
jgi:hypothetical protein